uniref:Proliferation-associated protein A n=1 Tax=Lygus hesperus TaxID=30085 RepID=A0A0A9WQ31_LYGHE
MFKGTEKGIGFPTCISVNHCVCHNSPGEGDEVSPQEIKLNDIVHYDFGIHVDGYCAQIAHTIQVTESGELCGEVGDMLPEGDDASNGTERYNTKAARVITAAHHILSTAQRKIRPGASIYDVT